MRTVQHTVKCGCGRQWWVKPARERGLTVAWRTSRESEKRTRKRAVDQSDCCTRQHADEDEDEEGEAETGAAADAAEEAEIAVRGARDGRAVQASGHSSSRGASCVGPTSAAAACCHRHCLSPD